MKKYLSISIAILLLSACEINDFCTKEVVTPNIQIFFVSKKKKTSDKKPTLSIWAPRKRAIIESNTDYIALPLNPNTNKTKYIIANEKDTSKIMIEYNLKEKFISRSCGYQRTYTDINIRLLKTPTNWIDSISQTKIPNINDQEKPHTIFYH